MASVYETRFDIIYRRLKAEKQKLKQEFDEAYAKDDFRCSMGIMESIQSVMNRLNALEAIEKPFKELAAVSSKIDDIKLEIEIQLEELGKAVKTQDSLMGLFHKELKSEYDELFALLVEEEGRNFSFEFEKFDEESLMALISYNKKNFPSRLRAYEEYLERQSRYASPLKVKEEEEQPVSDISFAVVPGPVTEAKWVFLEDGGEDSSEEPESDESLPDVPGVDFAGTEEEEIVFAVDGGEETVYAEKLAGVETEEDIAETTIESAVPIKVEDDAVVTAEDIQAYEEEYMACSDEEAAETGDYPAEPAYEETEAYPEEPAYEEAEAYPAEPVYEEDGTYQAGTVDEETEAYPVEPTYEEAEAYSEEPVYEEDGAYPVETSYAGEMPYQEEGYEEGEYPSAEEPVYEESGEYPVESGYAEDSYPDDSVYAEDGVYPADQVYGEDGVEQAEVVYDETVEYSEELSYETPVDYPADQAYAEESVYDGEPVYAEEGYAEEPVYDGDYAEETGTYDDPEAYSTDSVEYGEELNYGDEPYAGEETADYSGADQELMELDSGEISLETDFNADDATSDSFEAAEDAINLDENFSADAEEGPAFTIDDELAIDLDSIGEEGSADFSGELAEEAIVIDDQVQPEFEAGIDDVTIDLDDGVSAPEDKKVPALSDSDTDLDVEISIDDIEINLDEE